MFKEVLERHLPFGEAREKVGEKFRKEKIELATRAIERAYRLSVDEVSLSRLKQVRDDLEQNPEENLCLVFNHIAYSDPPPVLCMYYKYIDPEGKRDFILPASHYHMENNPFFAFGAKLGERFFEYDLRKLVQAYMIGDPKYGYTEEDARKTYRPFLRRLKKATNITLMVSPEGHRSKDNKLQRGEEGIELMVKLLYPVICLPVGIRYEGDDFKRSGLNIGKKVHLTVAQPIYKEDASTEVTLDDLMTRLASVLPPHMQGVWAESVPAPSI